jgi:glycosyltransferase involved in cell wall biosynthesis
MSRRNVVVAFAISPQKIGGRESFSQELARQLKVHGRHLILCFEDAPSAIVRDYLLEPGNVTIEMLPAQGELTLKNAKRFYRLLRKYRPETVLYALCGAVRLWPLLSWAHGVDRIFYNDGTSRLHSAKDYRASVLVRTLMSPLTQSICVSEFIKACSDREGIVPKRKSRLIYNAVDLKRSLGDGPAFRRQHGIPDDRFVILKVSWLVPEKGIDVALLACKEAVLKRKNLHFVFCGDGAYKETYQRNAAELGIADHVTWTGKIEDIAASGAFRAADLQIQCSQWQEAFCFAVVEGMSANLPIIASRIGGLPELVNDGVNGFLFEPQDHISLANHILELVDDASLRLSMGREGHRRAVERHDLTKNVAEWVDLILPSGQSKATNSTTVSHQRLSAKSSRLSRG